MFFPFAQVLVSFYLFNAVLTFLLFYKIVVTIHSVYFGPLSRFPGPKLRACSNIFEIYSTIAGNDNIDRPALHRKHGPIVRVGPRTLSFAGGDGVWKDIHGFNATKAGGIVKESLFYSKVFGFTDVSNLITSREHANHARQRKVLARSFSNTALMEQQPIFSRWAEIFKVKLADKASVANHIDLVKYYNCAAFDIMGDLTFNEDLNMLAEGECSPWVESIFGSVKAATFLLAFKRYSRVTRLLADTFLKYNPTVQEKQLENWKYCAERVDRRLQRTPKHPDLWSRILEKNEDPESLTMEEQYANAFLFMTAGTETIVSALSATTFYLLRNPQCLEKLTREIRSTFSTTEDMSLETLLSLKYLQAVIQEGLRLHPPLPIALPREIPKGGAQICGEWIPEGTVVGIHYLSIHTQEQYFKKPLEFHPERWLQDPEFEKDHLDMAKPFLMGPMNCIGKDLAMHEIRLVRNTNPNHILFILSRYLLISSGRTNSPQLLATVLLHFDVSLSDKSLDWNAQKVFTLWQKEPLSCKLTPAKAAF